MCRRRDSYLQSGDLLMPRPVLVLLLLRRTLLLLDKLTLLRWGLSELERSHAIVRQLLLLARRASASLLRLLR